MLQQRKCYERGELQRVSGRPNGWMLYTIELHNKNRDGLGCIV